MKAITLKVFERSAGENVQKKPRTETLEYEYITYIIYMYLRSCDILKYYNCGKCV